MHEQIDAVPDDGSTVHRHGRVSPALIGFGILAVLVIIFVAENGHRVRVRLIIPRVTMPVWLAIVICIGIGVVLDRLFLAWWRHRKTT